MPQFNHKITGKPVLISSEIKLLDSTIEINNSNDMPELELFEDIAEIPLEIIKQGKESLEFYFRSFNQNDRKLTLTFLASGYPNNKLPIRK